MFFIELFTRKHACPFSHKRMNREAAIRMALEFVSTLGLKWRIKSTFDADVSEWGFKVFEPSKCYYESSSFGPIACTQISWIDVDPCVVEKRGRLLPETKIDKKEPLIAFLRENDIPFVDSGNFVRIQSEPEG